MYGMAAKTAAGTTLLELVAVLSIISLLAVLALPPVDSLLSRSKSTAAINRLVGAINLTRQAAVQYQAMATLCALGGNGQCGADWAGNLTVFLDRNENAGYEAGEEIVYRIAPVSETSVTWRTFRNRQYLQMTPFGHTNFQNGNFTICPPDGDTKHARQLVVNVQGRARRNHEFNAAGYPVDRKGRVLRC